MGVFDGMSDDEIRRALGEGEKPAYKSPTADGTAALHFLAHLTHADLESLYMCATNTAALLGLGRVSSDAHGDVRGRIAKAVSDTARIAALLEAWTLALRVNAGVQQ